MIIGYYNRLARWLKKDPIKSLIVCLVFFVHFVFVMMIIFSPDLSVAIKKKPLVVKTKHQEAKKSLTASAAKPLPSQPKKQKTESNKAVIPAKETPIAKGDLPKKAQLQPEKVVAAKTPPPKATKPVAALKEPAAKNPQIPQELLDELEERIAKIEHKRDKISAPLDLSIPKTINKSLPLARDDLAPDQNFDQAFDNYSAYLISHLQQHLQLPDFGEVKVEIVLRPDGSVEKCSVLEAASEKNKKYLEKRLLTLRFPDQDLRIKKPQVFVLTFCN
jgi:hypothetical protein